MDEVLLQILSAGDAPAMVALLALGLARGWIITAREANLHRESAQMWKAAYDTKMAADTMTRAQFDELLEGSRTSRAFIESFMKAVDR
jgi:hypothetical protein